MSNLERLRVIAEEVRKVWPEKAAEIDAAIALAQAEGRIEGLKIDVNIGYRVEKFDGEYEPGKQPVETIEGAG